MRAPLLILVKANHRLRDATAAPKLLLLLAGLLLMGEAAGLAAQFSHDLPAFIAVALLQGAVWALAALVVVRSGCRGALPVILAMAVIFRLLALSAPVFLSDDINRYVWDGRVQAAGINPYRYVPNDPALAALRDQTIFWGINRSNYAPTIYPPVAQMLFLIANFCGGTVLAMKLVLVAMEAFGIAVLLSVLRVAGAPREQILLYAWHPLPIWEIAGSGHIDAAVVTFVSLALLAAAKTRQTWSGAALGAATLVKFFPAVLTPALWRPIRSNHGDWRWLAAFMAVAVAAYLPYIGVGPQVLGFLPGYVAEENLVSGRGFWLLDIARRILPVPLAAYFAMAAAVMAGLMSGALRRRSEMRSTLQSATALATATLFFASPHYPWYFVWLVALLTVAPWWPAWWLTVAAFLLYCDAHTGAIPLWVGFTLYGGFAILCGLELARRSYFAANSGVRHGG
jgi:alpha-1,6-mannosyltransferase